MLHKWQHSIYLVFVIVVILAALVENRSYNNGLIFYDLQTQQAFLPPTVSVSRGRVLSNVKYSDKGSIWSTFGKPCDCAGAKCGCCAGIKVKQYNFDEKMCANITFVHQKDEAILDVFLGDKPSARYGISARNPSPFCIPVMLSIPMAMCVQMSNIAIQGNNLNMCMDFTVRLATTDLFEMHFQCMQMGLDGLQYLDKNGQPVIPPGGQLIKYGDKQSEPEEDEQSAEYSEYYDELPVANENENENEIQTNENKLENEINPAAEQQEEDDAEEEEHDEQGYNVEENAIETENLNAATLTPPAAVAEYDMNSGGGDYDGEVVDNEDDEDVDNDIDDIGYAVAPTLAAEANVTQVDLMNNYDTSSAVSEDDTTNEENMEMENIENAYGAAPTEATMPITITTTTTTTTTAAPALASAAAPAPALATYADDVAANSDEDAAAATDDDQSAIDTETNVNTSTELPSVDDANNMPIQNVPINEVANEIPVNEVSANYNDDNTAVEVKDVPGATEPAPSVTVATPTYEQLQPVVTDNTENTVAASAEVPVEEESSDVALETYAQPAPINFNYRRAYYG